MMEWKNCKNLLVIRPDNMGDLLMSSPAIRALKESFQTRITVLTSSMSKAVAHLIPEIDEVMIYDLPWVKGAESDFSGSFQEVVKKIRDKQFDAAVIFTVYSQNPLPTAMLAYLAGIPRRLAYCRENPYHLLSDWVPEKEPYTSLQHQVLRDLDLVKTIGASSGNDRLSRLVVSSDPASLFSKLRNRGVDCEKPWLVLHPGVSETKREYPISLWIEAGRQLSKDYQLLLTGSGSEVHLTQAIQAGVGDNCFALAGELSLTEFILLISGSPLLVSVNTGPVHIAAACGTPVVVLYAMTNPQHTPWKVRGKVLAFDIDESSQSKNEVIRYVSRLYRSDHFRTVTSLQVVEAVADVLSGKAELISQIIPAPLPGYVGETMAKDPVL